MEKNKTVGVLFSGGLDSTYLVWENLKKGNVVYPFYFTIINNKDKPELERNRINVLHKSFYETYGNLIKSPENVISLEVKNAGSKLHLNQVPIWILGLQFCQMNALDEIQIGYVMNDDAISYIDNIKKIYKSYNGISDSQIPIKFPLLKKKKEELFASLPKKYRDLTITCEDPRIIDSNNENVEILKYEPCGRCPACIKNISVRNQFNDFPENYKNIQIENSLNYLENFGKILHRKQENNRHFITFEFSKNNIFSEPNEKIIQLESKQSEPKQLELDFGFDYKLSDRMAKLKENYIYE